MSSSPAKSLTDAQAYKAHTAAALPRAGGEAVRSAVSTSPALSQRSAAGQIRVAGSFSSRSIPVRTCAAVSAATFFGVMAPVSNMTSVRASARSVLRSSPSIPAGSRDVGNSASRSHRRGTGATTPSSGSPHRTRWAVNRGGDENDVSGPPRARKPSRPACHSHSPYTNPARPRRGTLRPRRCSSIRSDRCATSDTWR